MTMTPMTRTREHDLPARVRDGSAGERIHLDPRTKLALIAAMAVAVALAPGPAYEMILMAAACAFSALLGRTRAGVIMLALYAAVIAAARLAPHLDGIAARTALASFLLLMRKVLACSLMAYATVTTTQVGEFMSALARLRAPRGLTIPLAVALRYAPAVREDWAFIRDAMRMRGISPGPVSLLASPGRTVDCVYVPLLMSAGRVSDELSMAAIARGIENPVARTCYLHIAMRPVDWLMLLLGLGAVAGAVVCRVCGAA